MPWKYAGLAGLRFFRRAVQLVGNPGQVRGRSGLHLSHQLAAMDFNRDLADANVLSYLLVDAAGHHRCHHLTLARRESRARPQLGDRLFVRQPGTISRDPQLDRVQQVLITERLGQKLHRSPLHRLDIGMSPYPVVKMIGT